MITNGIKLISSSNNTILDNIYSKNIIGIQLDTNSNDNYISRNNCSNNWNGIYVSSCQDNNLTENIISQNDNCGINFTSSTDNNLIYNNILYNNSINGCDNGINNWNKSTIGNYWDDAGQDYDFDGIADTPYNLFGVGNRKDYYPLILYNPIILTHPTDITFEIGDEGNDITWVLINLKPNLQLTFNLFKDGTSIKTGKLCSFKNEINVNVDGLVLGTFGYTLEVQDEEGGTRSDGVEVKVINTAPSFVQTPSDMSFEVGSGHKNLSWIFSDNSTNSPTYTLARNGIPILADVECEAGEFINISVDGLQPGNYTYILTIYDGYGKSTSDLVMVDVINNAPIFTQTPSDLLYEVGRRNNNLSWIFSDNSTNNPKYTLNKDGIPIVVDEVCEAGKFINISVDDLLPGNYNYIIIIEDGYGKSKSDHVSVEVTNTAPNLISTPPNLNYTQGENGNRLSWIFSDISMHNATYSIFRNGIEIIKETPCNSGECINISVDGLSPGIYVYSIEIDDGYGKTISDIATITVFESSSTSINIFTEYSSLIIAFSIIIGCVVAALIIGFFLRKRTAGTSKIATERENDLKKIKKKKDIKGKKEPNKVNKTDENKAVNKGKENKSQ